MDVALVKAHELGYDEHKPRLKEARVNVSLVIRNEFSFSKNLFLSGSYQR
jgi:hypothetical protein